MIGLEMKGLEMSMRENKPITTIGIYHGRQIEHIVSEIKKEMSAGRLKFAIVISNIEEAITIMPTFRETFTELLKIAVKTQSTIIIETEDQALQNSKLFKDYSEVIKCRSASDNSMNFCIRKGS